MNRYPALFIAHGIFYEALTNPDMQRVYGAMRRHLPEAPRAIVVISPLWLTQAWTVTTATIHHPELDGYPNHPRIEQYRPAGSPQLAHSILARLLGAGYQARGNRKRGLDLAALLPLSFLFPDATIPVVQLSLQSDLDPDQMIEIALTLEDLRAEGILLLATGATVYNRSQLSPFSGFKLTPADWAQEFDQLVAQSLLGSDEPADELISLIQQAAFSQAHPTGRNHFLPLVFTAALGAKPRQIYRGFQWRNLALSSYIFE